jgi:hypothetical protein
MWRSVVLVRIDEVLVTANVVSRELILLTLIMEAMHSSETSARKTAARRHIPKDGTLHSHCLENLRSYIALTGWAL